MGCGGSSSNKEGQVEQQRRRLSVGNVDKEDGTQADSGNNVDEDRGIITALGQENIVEMIANSGNDGDRKFSIGSQTDQAKTSFANKSMQQLGDKVDPAQEGLGYTCRKGLKPESPNQDSWFVFKLENSSSMYGVFDGHGQKGHDVSNFVKENLPKLMLKDQRFNSTSDTDRAQMLVDSFKKIQSLVSTSDRMKKLSAQMSGTTATMAIQDHAANKIHLAHVADSTAVLGKKVDGKFKAVQLTRDHKPDLKDEKARIEKAGGRVVFDGYANHRVYAKNARYPGLNMSRCLGDLLGHQDCGISCEPETQTLPITPEDEILLLCSDGVWEFVSPQEAVDIVGAYPSPKAMQAADRLAKEAWDRWIKEEGGAVVDDITVVLVYLQAAKLRGEALATAQEIVQAR